MLATLMRRRFAILITIGALLLTAAAPVDADGKGTGGKLSFDRRGPAEESPSGNSVLADCQAPGAEDPAGWPDATATLRIRQSGGHSRITINVRNARPDTYFTVWLRLGGNDSNGDPFGTNPLTDGKATPLAPTSDLPALLTSTGPDNGNDEQPNGFRTDRRGNGRFRTTVDFPISGGAYPFQRFPGWDPKDERLPAANPAVYPVAIAGPQGPYTLRIVSHCTDEVGHGLQSGPREWWFDWTVPE